MQWIAYRAATAYQIEVNDEDDDGANDDDKANYSDFARHTKKCRVKNEKKKKENKINGNNAFFALEEEMVMLIRLFAK